MDTLLRIYVILAGVLLVLLPMILYIEHRERNG